MDFCLTTFLLPDAVIQAVSEPLSDKIACLLGLCECLMTMNIRYVKQSVSFNCHLEISVDKSGSKAIHTFETFIIGSQ